MFQPAPRRHRRLPTGTSMVSYAEVKSYLSKREIPQLFESLMAGLMYHRPENHIGYLQSCLEEVKSNGEAKVQWSTFVNAKKRKSKEIVLPPLTPPNKKQDSFSSSWSDNNNSRQSTPLPPISARTRRALEQQDFRNTYVLYHNPPPILAKPKVPVISVLGGLGTKIDELCERVVGRLRGVVHISTCSMLKTRMTIEGFYRVTSVPACAVVDSVLQAMSMVHSASALLIAGFPRHRGDIEEYRSRRVRMDGVVLVDFEEEALRHFLEHEVASGLVRTSEIDSELERFKQDIISVAEYYDQKNLLTVVMGDQDMEEIIDDLVLAVDKIIETRKNVEDEDAVDGKRAHECESPCKALIASPDKLERPSTVEIRDATEEDIKAIEEEAKKLKENEETDEEVAKILTKEQEFQVIDGEPSTSQEAVEAKDVSEEEGTKTAESEVEKVECEKEGEEETKKEEEVESTKEGEEESKKEEGEETAIEAEVENGKEKEESTKEGEEEQGEEETEENRAEHLSQTPEIPRDEDNDSVTKGEDNEKDESNGQNSPGEKENFENEENDEELKQSKPNIPLVFAMENINTDYEEIKNLIANDLEMCFIDFYELLRNDGSEEDKFDNDEAMNILGGILKQDNISYSNGFFVYKFPFSLLNENVIEELSKLGNISFVSKAQEDKSESESEKTEDKLINSMLEKTTIIFINDMNPIDELRTVLQEIINNKNVEENTPSENANKDMENEEKIEQEDGKEPEEEVEKEPEEEVEKEPEQEVEKEPEQEVEKEPEQEDESTGKDVEDLVSDDTLNEGSKPPESLKTDDNQDLEEGGVDDTHSQASTIASAADETQRERAVLERQSNLEIEENASQNEGRSKPLLLRQSTYSASEGKETEEDKDEPNESVKDTSASEHEPPVDTIVNENEGDAEKVEEENKESEKNNDVAGTEDETELKNEEPNENKDEGSECAEQSSENEQPTNEENKEDNGENVTNEVEATSEDENKETMLEEHADNTEKENSETKESEENKDDNAEVTTLDGNEDEQVKEESIQEAQPESHSDDANENNEEKTENNDENAENNELENEDAESEKKNMDGEGDAEGTTEINETEENVKENESVTERDARENEDPEKSEDGSAKQEKSLSESAENGEDEKDETEEKLENESDDKSQGETKNIGTTKIMDNDSDSNDENITIETKAEIHAVDCAVTPTEEENSDNKSEKDTDNKEEEHKSENENSKNDDLENNKKNEDLNRENSAAHDDEKDDDPSIKDIDSMGNERYSGKVQERNGSGILDESRQEEVGETEEPQERSSSSSRGEL